MDFNTARDHARTYLTHNVKPFIKLEEVLDAAVEASQVVHDAETRLAALGQEEHDIRNRLQVLGDALVTREAEVEEARQRSEGLIVDLERSMREATQAAQEVIRGAEESAAAKRATLEADYATRKTLLHAELESLEARRNAVNQVVVAMKAKMAALEEP